MDSSAVVITGVSGSFPESENVNEFRDNLFNDVDLVTDDERRWTHFHPEIPRRSGKLKDITKFDSGYFGVSKKTADCMEPLVRLLAERVFEAMVDAGHHPDDFENEKAAVFVAGCSLESEMITFCKTPTNAEVMGRSTRFAVASHIPYFFKLNGTTTLVDTACSSSMYALDAAYNAFKRGDCDKAIVCGTSLCIQPFGTLQFARLGVLSLDGSCKSFDDAGNGYVRSEGVVAIILERAPSAKRIYAQVVHSKTNCDGYKEEGITFPSSKLQKTLMREFYDECQIDPASLTFVEAHGTGTPVGDPQELATIDEIFCKNRDKPLLLGSIKSNIGHNEPVSGLCSIVKVLIGFESGFIPPNKNFKTPRKGVKALEEGRLKVVTKKTPWPDKDVYVGINSFGFGGANGHVLLHWNNKDKNSIKNYQCKIPKMICLSGRTQESLKNTYQNLIRNDFDPELIKLIHQVYKKKFLNHLYDGFLIFDEKLVIEKSISKRVINKNKLTIIFNDFKHDALKLHEILINIPRYELIYDEIKKIIYELNIVSNEINNILIQLILAGILKSVLIKTENVTSIGVNYDLKVISNYYNGELSLKEAVLKLCTKKHQLNGDYEDVFGNVDGDVVLIGNDEDFGLNNRGLIRLIDQRGDVIVNFLKSLGKLFLKGFSVELDQIYPEIQYPVSRGTPMLAPLIKWDHRKDCYTYKFSSKKETRLTAQDFVHVNPKESQWDFVMGHIIDGRNLYPATGYLCLAWETLCASLGTIPQETTVVFEDIKFLRASYVPSKGTLSLKVTVNSGTKSFSISENENVLVAGKISISENEGFYRNNHLERGYLMDREIFMEKKDVYKELRLRGYNYQGEFKSIERYGLSGKLAVISWKQNFVSFMDNMLQLQILEKDSRNLYVPTSINKVIIDAKKHQEFAQLYKNELPAYLFKEVNIISSGGVEISGLGASNIARKKPPSPVLESYKFVPNRAKLTSKNAIRCIIQTILENTNTIKVKAIEIIKNDQTDPLITKIQQTLNDLPLIQPELTVFSKNPNLNLDESILIQSENLKLDSDYLVIIATNLLNNNLNDGLRMVKNVSGFVITKEENFNEDFNDKIDVLCCYETEIGKLLLLKESNSPPSLIEPILIDVSSIDDLKWVETIKFAKNNNKKIIIYSQNKLSGSLGLINCLRREFPGDDITSMIIMDEKTRFDLNNSFFKKQLNKNLAINVLENNQWGSYRHLLLDPDLEVENQHCYVNVTTKGDLSSLKWLEGSINPSIRSELNAKKIVDVYYGAINFRDVMLASGKLSADVITSNRILQENVQGFEFSGVVRNGEEKVMGMITSGALSTIVEADPKFLWPIPNRWSLEEAATVPVVYSTVLYAFIMRGRMKHGQSILIHSGTGGIGQAAINIATHMGCTIFVTVGTKEKRNFIIQNFPQIDKNHIGDSRSTSFEQMIFKETNGKGVDFVLNSLAEEKLLASVRCLSKNGTFLEIGKFDLANNNDLASSLLKKQARFEGVMLDRLFAGSDDVKEKLGRLLISGIKNGSVKPLVRTVFPSEKVEEAFRFMGAGKHIGKVLLKIRQNGKPQNGIPRLCCDPNSTYIILGGLGGFGLELADWLVTRGAKTLILTSRSPKRTGYQNYRLNIFKSYNVNVIIRNDDITSMEGCENLLKFAESLHPVQGIFNLAVVLEDALFENQTIESFKTSLGPKAYATRFLDEISRKICAELKYFVVFSSVSCGRGNAGQTNYGFSNSVMERICEKRKMEGFPGLAIQWGAIGDVGLVADMQDNHKELVIGGTLQQKISNCLQILDRLLKQDEAIVSSMVVAEKRTASDGMNILDVVLGIIGVTNKKSVSFHSTLPELGMDSMMAVEIKQTLEREFEILLTPQDLRNITLAKIEELKKTPKIDEETPTNSIPNEILIFCSTLDEDFSTITPLVPLMASNSPTNVFAFPGIEGSSSIFKPFLSKNPKINLFSFQYCLDNLNTIESLTNNLIDVYEDTKSGDFNILAYSFGTVIATEFMYRLEQKGKVGKAFFIDGSIPIMKKLVNDVFPVRDQTTLESSILFMFLIKFMSFKEALKHKDQIHQLATLSDKAKYLLKLINRDDPNDCLLKFWKCQVSRLKSLDGYVPLSNFKLKSKIFLAKPSQPSVVDVKDDYELSNLSLHPVEVKVFEGNHSTILENDALIEEINKFFL
nr:fatty acid synthase-like [Onthophagus taurus]